MKMHACCGSCATRCRTEGRDVGRGEPRGSPELATMGLSKTDFLMPSVFFGVRRLPRRVTLKGSRRKGDPMGYRSMLTRPAFRTPPRAARGSKSGRYTIRGAPPRLALPLMLAVLCVLGPWGQAQAEALPVIAVDVQQQGVGGWEWPAAAPVTVTIEDGDGVEPDLVVPATTGPEGDFWAWPLAFDIEPGDTVTVTDGTATKITEVAEIGITGVDLDAATVSGTANDGAEVGVEVYAESEDWIVRWPSVSGGSWTAGFGTAGPRGDEGVVCDLAAGSEGSAFVQDSDGDRTRIEWRVPRPRFSVSPGAAGDSFIRGEEWDPGSVVTVAVGASETTASVDDNGEFDSDLPFDVAPGDTVNVTGGASSKSTVVADLAVTGIDTDEETVSGSAPEGVEVGVEVFTGSEQWVHRWVAGGVGGGWTANFRVPGPAEDEDLTWDIESGTEGSAIVTDDDGDETQVNWRVPKPVFGIRLGNAGESHIDGEDWAPGSLVTIAVGASEATVSVGADGTFATDLPFAVVVGDTVAVGDGASSKSTEVALTVVDVDTDLSTVSGLAPDGATVRVEVYDTPDDVVRRAIVAAGKWSADFAHEGSGDDEGVVWALGPGSFGSATTEDVDGDSTQVDWNVPKPRFRVYPDFDFVDGDEWGPGSTITIASGSAEATASVNDDGYFGLDLPFDVEVGDTVTVTDGGSTTKETIVAALVASKVDPGERTVSGTAPADSRVGVEVFDTPDWVVRWPVVTGGNWTADFAHAGPEEDENRTWDFVPMTEGAAFVVDGDGDSTAFTWHVSDPETVLHGAPASWTRDEVSFSLEATDGVGRGDELSTYYSLNGGPDIRYSMDSTVPVTAEGTTVVRFRTHDEENGIDEEEKTVTILIDRSPPQTSDDHRATYAGSAALHLSATDSHSGVTRTDWLLDGAEGTGSVVATSALGPHHLEYWSTDASGNRETTKTADFVVAAAVTAPVSVVLGKPRVSPSTPKRGKRATFSVGITPGAAGAAGASKLFLLHQETKTVVKKVKGKKKRVKVTYWRQRAKLVMRSSSSGVLSVTAKLSQKGKWKAYAVYAGSEGYLAASSGTRAFTVK